MAHMSYKNTIAAMFARKEPNPNPKFMSDEDDTSTIEGTKHTDSDDVEDNNKSGIRLSPSAVTLDLCSVDDASEIESGSLHKHDTLRKFDEEEKERTFLCCNRRCIVLVAIFLILAVTVGTTVGKHLGKNQSVTDNASTASSPIFTGYGDSEVIDESIEATASPTSSKQPSTFPSSAPSMPPSSLPTGKPSVTPSVPPSDVPSFAPSDEPSATPSASPSNVPSFAPSTVPTVSPTNVPTGVTASPTRRPTNSPTKRPTNSPTNNPTKRPTNNPTKRPTNNPTARPTNRPTDRQVTNADFSLTNTNLVVGVYYYPWYSNADFHGRKYVRNDISPKQLPAIGEYSQRDPATISKHLEMSRRANVNLWVSSWWGPRDPTDLNTIGIMNNKDFPGTKLSLLYETSARVQNGDMRNVYNDFAYITQTYFDNPNYFRVNGCPAVYIYLARSLDRVGKLDDAVNQMRKAARDNGHCIYLVGDAVYGRPQGTDYRPFEILDAVTGYDVFGSMGRPRYAGQDGVNNYRDQQAGWRNNAKAKGCGFIPSVTPGYNEKGTRNLAEPMSRKLTANSGFGSLFQALLANAVQQTDEATGHILMVNSWNEWHEDTQIEPVGGSGVTTSPNSKTAGLEYEAYGNRYLDILAAATRRR